MLSPIYDENPPQLSLSDIMNGCDYDPELEDHEYPYDYDDWDDWDDGDMYLWGYDDITEELLNGDWDDDDYVSDVPYLRFGTVEIV